MNKIAVIGGGASALLASITAKRNNPSVDITIFEKSDRVGKKILASGNGRCNITNRDIDAKNYFGSNPDFVKYSLNCFGFSHFKKFCDSIGLILDIKSDGKVYPLSNEASSVTTLLEKEALGVGIGFKFDHEVRSVIKKDRFIIDGEEFDKVLIASGLGAAPQLGSSESGMELAAALGHNTIPTFAVLAGLEIDSNFHHKMFGVKTNAEVTLYVDNSQEEKITGDILFTKYGISGFAILDISTNASYALKQGQNVTISLNLLPQFDRNRLFGMLSGILKANPQRSIEELLIGILPKKIIPFVVAKDLRSTVNNIQNMRFVIKDTHGFKHAEASGGGIDVSEVDEKTMQSKKVEGLYFCGEVLDIVGQRGGYNFAWAWSSGYIAGISLSKLK